MNKSLPEKVIIDISTITLLKILFIILGVILLFFIKGIILIVFVALILASAFDPWVDWLQKHKIPRGLGIVLIYLAMIAVLATVIYLIIPPIAIEVNQLSKDFPAYWEKINAGLKTITDFSNTHGLDQTIGGYLNNLQQSLSANAAGNVFDTLYSFFGGIVSFIVILMITFYMTVDEQGLKRMLRSVVPIKHQPYFTHLINRMQEKIGYWLRGQLILSLIIFVISYLVLLILGVKYALVLALFAGITELIPFLGPIIGAVPAAFIAFIQSPTIAIVVIIAYLIIHQLENNILVPKVMERVVGLNPIVTLVAMLIGFEIAGILGVILAVPVATILGLIFSDLLSAHEDKSVA